VLPSAFNRLSASDSSEIFQYVLELIACRRLLGNVELELGPLCLVLSLVGAGLVFGRMGYRLRIGLPEEGEDAGGCLVVRLVEEGNDVLRAVLLRTVSSSIAQFMRCACNLLLQRIV
jgi:hypothetical protein